ncbi:MAG TPA: lipocalin family protein [Candidatus Kapabacteria bacterium]|nr:lipocalin family protein [Candidatus Kapabacteria bacterium]
MMNRNLLLAVVLSAVVAGCGGKEKTPGTPSAGGSSGAKSGSPAASGPGIKAKLLVDKTWKVTEVTSDPAVDLNGDGKANTDLIASGEIPECQLDDTDVYHSDGTFEADHGALKCSPQERAKDVGRWSFNADSTVISTSLGGRESGLHVLELTGTTLKESVNISKENRNYTFVVTFVAK